MPVAQGNLEEGARRFGEGLTIAEQLSASDPGNPGWRRDLPFGCHKIGQLLTRQEKWAEALPYFERALEIDERNAALDPSNVMWQNDARVSRRQVDEARAKVNAK